MKHSHRELEPHINADVHDFGLHSGKVLWDLRHSENQALLGGFSLHGFALEGDTCEFGYWILPDFQGQGLVREAGEIFLDYLFEYLAYDRITLKCDLRNTRSCHLARRLGFQHEASLQGRDAATGERVTRLIFARYP